MLHYVITRKLMKMIDKCSVFYINICFNYKISKKNNSILIFTIHPINKYGLESLTKCMKLNKFQYTSTSKSEHTLLWINRIYNYISFLYNTTGTYSKFNLKVKKIGFIKFSFIQQEYRMIRSHYKCKPTMMYHITENICNDGDGSDEHLYVWGYQCTLNITNYSLVCDSCIRKIQSSRVSGE